MKCWSKFPNVMRTASLIVLCGLLFLAGCQSPSQSGLGPESETKLELTGNTVGSHVMIDDRLTFDVANQARTQFRLRPGRHHIRIEKGGATVVDQTVSLSRGQTLDVAVP